MVMRMKWNSIVARPVLCLLTSGVSASEPGFYVIATAGTGDEDPKTNGLNFGNSQGIIRAEPDQVEVDDGSLAWGVGIGYRVNRYFAGEVEYADFGTTDVHEHYSVPNAAPIPFPTEFDLVYSSKVTGPVLSVLGTLPLGHNFEVFLRGGALFADREYSLGGPLIVGGQDQNFASTVWLAGAGGTWSFAGRWGVRAEYQKSGPLDTTLATGETRVKRISLSAVYRF